MFVHPFLETKPRKIGVMLILAIAVFINSSMFFLYGGVPWETAIIDSALSMGGLFVLAFFFWFIIDVINIYQAEIILSVCALLVWLVICFIIQMLDFPVDKTFLNHYLRLLPMRLGVCVLLWVNLLQWYRMIKLQRWKKDRLLTESIQAPLEETIDRIAVKNGSRIHIIPVKELSHIQACGDYVMLFTHLGEFLKEQTMKSLETHLPSNFVRIHRSHIVNVELIDKVELYGKETYTVFLKNGVSLRASVSGYKLLKNILSL